MALGLEGIKVVELAGALAVPMAGRLLADWGADVMHIERLATDVQASFAVPGFIGGASPIAPSDINYIQENYNRSKRSATVDVSKKRGQEIIYKLVEKADVFLTNMRPYEMKKWKFEYDTLSRLNPRLVYAAMNGYGAKGAERDKPSYDIVAAWSRTGIRDLMEATGFRPAFVDNIAGLALAYGIMTALFIRERTGIGQEVDLSLFQTGVFHITVDVAGALVTGQNYDEWKLPSPSREERPNALVDWYQTKDRRTLGLAMLQPERYWSRFCQAIGREDLEHDPRFESFEPRIANHVALLHILDEVFLTRNLDEWKVRLNEADIPWAPVQTLQELVHDPQARANDFFVPLDHPTYGRIEVVANPITLSKTKATVKMAPESGQHTEEVLLEHGYTWEDIAQLKEQGIIG